MNSGNPISDRRAPWFLVQNLNVNPDDEHGQTQGDAAKDRTNQNDEYEIGSGGD
ncbi:hypothetical protein [Flavobacterium hercynium]|uniref:hypothetical protein n=1 Tax=Flavobacterium hercynium TaxID=387094 RepID=UPI0013FD3ACD|nr:hypothetical protein [Flavobacterium hercynium]SMP19624.1 hypothetical protein SAMN06265346_10650 [Flavobacterium hercynium]